MYRAEYSERNKSIFKMRNAGETFEAIARMNGISTERARQIYLEQKRTGDALMELCVQACPNALVRRVYNLLLRHSIETIDQLKRLDCNTVIGWRNAGRATVDAIRNAQAQTTYAAHSEK